MSKHAESKSVLQEKLKGRLREAIENGTAEAWLRQAPITTSQGRDLCQTVLKKAQGTGWPYLGRLKNLSRRLEMTQIRKDIRQMDLEKPRVMLRFIGKWGHPKALCLRLAAKLKQAMKTRSSWSAPEYGRRAHKKIQRFLNGEQPQRIGRIAATIHRKTFHSKETPLDWEPGGEGPTIRPITIFTHQPSSKRHDPARTAEHENDFHRILQQIQHTEVEGGQ